MIWILLALLALWIGLGVSVFRSACVRMPDPDWADPAALEHTLYKKIAPKVAQMYHWVQDHAARECEITSFDGLTLRAYWIPAEKAKGTVILFHGFRSSGYGDFSMTLERFHDLGYSILLPSQRAHGRSDGKYLTYGVKERQDVAAWVDFHNREFGVQPVFLCGMSMGAATVLGAADLELAANVRGILADCGFTSPDEIIADVVEKRTHIPAWLVMPQVRLLAKLLADFDLRGFSTVDTLANTKLPVLMVHGTADNFVPCSMTERGFAACASPKELLLVEGAGHGSSYLVDPDRYEAALQGFLNKHN